MFIETLVYGALQNKVKALMGKFLGVKMKFKFWELLFTIDRELYLQYSAMI